MSPRVKRDLCELPSSSMILLIVRKWSAGNTKGKVWLLLIKPHEKQQFSFPAFQIIGDAIGLINRPTLEIPYLGLSIM